MTGARSGGSPGPAPAAERRAEVALAGHRGDAPTAQAALADEDPVVRTTAIGALERLGRLTDDDLTTLLADPAPEVRRRAAEAAARHPGVDLLPALDDPDPSVVEVAAFACGEQATGGRPVVARLADLAGHAEDALVREAAVAALGAIGDPAGLAAVLDALADRAAVRRRAVIALAAFEGPAVEAALERARHDRDWQVRQIAEDLGTD